MRWIILLLLSAQFVSASTAYLLNSWPALQGGAIVFNDTVGYSFTVQKHPLRVTRIGVLPGITSDPQRNVNVGIWSDSGALIFSGVIPEGNIAPFEGNFRWLVLPAAIVLDPYTNYRVACQSDAISYYSGPIPSDGKVSNTVTVNGAVRSLSRFTFAFPSQTSSGMVVGPNLNFEILPYDTTPPAITLNGSNPQTVYRGTTFTDLGATVTDDFDATRTITGSGTVDTTTVGSYTLTYSAQDEVGNVATPGTRTVQVVLDPNGDEDNDGLNNTEEANLGTNPYLRDTDSDGVNDLREVGDGSDPLDRASFDSLSLGLVAYYPFDGNAKDGSGNGHNGTMVGSTTVPSGPSGLGQALQIDGTNDSWMEIADTSMLRPTATTISAWVYNNRSDNSDVRFVCGKNEGQMEIHIGGQQPNVQSGIRFIPNGDYTIDTAEGTPAQQWFHLVCVAGEGSGGAKIYINGVEASIVRAGVSDGSQPLALGHSPFYLGRRENNGWPHLEGKIDNVRVYSRILSADEVAEMFAIEQYGGFGLEGAATKSPFDPATALNWSAGGTAWTVDTTVTHDGVDSVKAQTTDGQSTYREYTVTGPAVADFWWKVSSEKNYDKFSYSLNGVNQATISGEVDWTHRTLTLPAGDHTIRWTYSKDESGAVGQDAGWLDDFVVYPATATLQMRDGSTVLGGTATVDFGSAETESMGFSKSLTFANEGYVPLEVQLALPDDSPFRFEDGSGVYELLLGRDESLDVPIVLSTQGAGTRSAQLTVLAPDSTIAPPAITLTGYVRGPDIGVAQGGSSLTSGQTFDMGLTPQTVEFTLRNNGNTADLVISAVSATGNFQITQQPATTIPPQGSTTFKVLAQNVASGLHSGSVSIASNAGNLATFSLPLTSKSLTSATEGIADGSMATSGTGGATAWDFAATTLPSGQSGQALKTGSAPNNSESVLEFTTQAAGVVSWSWRVSTQEDFDWLLCEVDGQEAAGISTKTGAWQTQVVNVPAGATIRWVYRKDASGSIGEDAGYLVDVEFRNFAANQSFGQWAQTHGVTDPQQRMPKSGLPAMFEWLGGFRVDGDAIPDIIVAQGRLTYRYPVSKTADGTQQILFSGDMSSWTTRRISQRVVSEDADRVVIEATAPSGTKGFFKVATNADANMVRVAGGILPQNSELAGTTVSTFQIGRTEVTWAEWQEVRGWAVANGYPDLAGVGQGVAPDHPVQNVNWYDVVKWTNAKSERSNLKPVYGAEGGIYRNGQMNPSRDLAANGYRLPAESEWEWAARGGDGDQGYTYSGSNDLDAVAWYNVIGGGGTKQVAIKLPNELGLHDMSGNVWEWIEDAFTNGRRHRSGSWTDPASNCRITARGGAPETYASDIVGFRVARNAD